MAKKKRTNKKTKRRLLLALIIFGSIIYALGYKFFDNLRKIDNMKQEKLNLENKIVELEEEEKKLQIDVQKLEDPSYVARYAREKYLYSKDGEIIIRIE